MPSKLLLLLLAGAAVAIGIYVHRRGDQGETVQIPGMVRQTEIRLAPEITGRLASLSVSAGQVVREGDLIAQLDNPELAASAQEARAALASASADRARVYAGVRAEEVAISRQAVATSQSNLRLEEQQNFRATALASRSFASRQQLDERNASLAKAKADLVAKTAQLAADEAGPTVEERSLADAKVALAQATLASILAQLDKTRLAAPHDGVIGVRVAEPGEIIAPGKPVATLLPLHGHWFGFTLREDLLRGLKLGETLPLLRPDGSRVEARVTELRPLGEFATWRAARAAGDHDLNSFRVRFEPVNRMEGLEPGMTLWLERGR